MHTNLIFVQFLIFKCCPKMSAARLPPPLRGPNSFNFMQFLGNFGKIVCWRPPGSWRPLLGEILDLPLARNQIFSIYDNILT